ncbi:MAG: bifunctional DNA-formamidopyrimidine glycosylase/DNA-(apurinic or apyrimidinic site) lyase [Betaproteobacteria bacterium]|nr:bifunctional DNA-formamidopyrimidine glycosylase/DNA-(apurinic or apyrimidinic site) lyase [Betaproteobacteria bacterium]MDE2123601.1 bifunctional DNA-formamidopyrimidine glycosylase/DNA-(apurinic or apyrimidinic site) lyase [Betaproteobacteria bacterium]MDE2186153.1 bifunctional DNA-formamidopyrimidine glycosylase/DNA-(apurinic or apyrimidinic site) lyase [Betaproteobacteria bacterium]MDE2323150.1 bifunctional DNA-formamidopyrimidine glycosylase/DNA-(apurinic or apyrimidinic site) lyase [Bet
MPELPEVEVTRLGLERALTGARIDAIIQGKVLRWPLGCATQQLVGQRIERLDRRGKYLLLRMQAGDLIVHLGMSGSLRWTASDQPAEALTMHDHFVWITDRGQLRLRDPRRFGAVVWQATGSSTHALLDKLGPEPLGTGFDGSVLHQALRGRKAAIKPLLLNQSIVTGVGNIYACEALFHAGVHPLTPAGQLSRARCERLAQAIRNTLGAAVAAGGSSLRNFAHADGELGYFQLNTRVYDRAGLPCHACGARINRINQGQRSTYFCPHCQKRPAQRQRHAG